MVLFNQLTYKNDFRKNNGFEYPDTKNRKQEAKFSNCKISIQFNESDKSVCLSCYERFYFN